MRSMRFLFTIALMMGMSSAALADETVAVKLGFQSTAISGQFAGTVNGVGTQLDIKNDLGFKRSNNVTAEAALQLGDFRLQAGYLPLDFKGSGTLTRTVNFNGQTYTAGTAVDSRIKANIYDLAITYYLINMNDVPSRFQLGVEASAKIIQSDLSLTSAGLSNKVSATVPIPTIGLRARVALADFLGLVGRVGYMGYNKNHFLDADAQLEFSPIPMLGLYAGYRQMDLKVDTSGVYLKTQLGGPFIGAFARF